MRLRTPEIFLGAFLAVAIFAMGMLFASSLQPQSYKQAATAEQQTPDKKIDHHEQAQSLWVPTDSVGLYTLVLAVFTGLLTIVSGGQGYFLLRADRTARIAAEAAKQSADAAIAVESARLLFVPRSHNYWEAVGQYAARWPNSPQMGPIQNTVEARFALKNYGKTPDILMEVCAKLEYLNQPLETLTAFAPYLDLPVETVIGHGLTTDEFKLEIPSFFTMAEAIALSNDEGAIWLRGRAVYDDVFERECTQWFVYRLNITGGGFTRFYEKSNYRNAQHRTALS